VDVREDHCQACVGEVTGRLGFGAIDTRERVAAEDSIAPQRTRSGRLVLVERGEPATGRRPGS
jgi:hypothetical protein